MKKIFLTLVAACMLAIPQIVFAADVPDIRQISPNIVLEEGYPAEADEAGCYEYGCKSGNPADYVSRYVQLLTKSGFKLVGFERDGSYLIYGSVHPGKKVRAVEFYAVPSAHVLVECTETEIQIRPASGISYGK